MAKSNTSEALECMSCGAPIKSGFFCQKCQSGENEEAKPADVWKGSRFTGEAKKKRQRQLLMEDLGRWGKRLAIVAVVVGLGYGAYTMFGPQVKARLHDAQRVTAPKPKYDPTKDATTNEDNQGQAGNGKRAFGHSGTREKSVDGSPD